MSSPFMHRNPNFRDFYQTPYSMTQQLLDLGIFRKDRPTLEPACGDNAMVDILIKNRFTKLTYYDRETNFLKETRKFDYIITNPPYNIVDRFIIKAKQCCNDKFAFLLRTNFLSGQARFDTGIYNELKEVYIFSRMPDLRAPIREDGKYPTAGIVYAWMIWEKGYSQSPAIKWIDSKDYVLKKSDM